MYLTPTCIFHPLLFYYTPDGELVLLMPTHFLCICFPVIQHACLIVEMPILLLIARVMACRFIRRLQLLEKGLSVSMVNLEDNASPMAEETTICNNNSNCNDQIRSVNDAKITRVPSVRDATEDVTDLIQEKEEPTHLETDESITMDEIMKEVGKTMENGNAVGNGVGNGVGHGVGNGGIDTKTSDLVEISPNEDSLL